MDPLSQSTQKLSGNAASLITSTAPSTRAFGIGTTPDSMAPAKPSNDRYSAPNLATSSTSAVASDQLPPTISLFDLDALLALPKEERLEQVQVYVEKLKTVGFVAIKAAELSELLPEVYGQMRGYFHQSLDEKMQCWTDTHGQSGYAPAGNETATGAPVADHKETFFIQPESGGLDRIWPKTLPKFQPVMEEYYHRLRERAIQSMTVLLEGLGVSTKGVREDMLNAGNLLRLAYYPKMETAQPDAISAAAHKDLNCLTILPRPTQPGLRLLQKNGEWLDVHVPEGYVIVNTGQQAELMTAGEIQATLHEVRIPDPSVERLASIFFASYPHTMNIQPYPECVERMKEQRTPKENFHWQLGRPFEEATFGDYLTSRLIEMGSIAKPGRDLVVKLRVLNLLQQPPQALKELYPQILPG